MPPERTLLTVGAYAQHRGVSPQQVSRWKREERLVVVHGRIDAEASDAALDGALDACDSPHGASAADRKRPTNCIWLTPPRSVTMPG